MVLVKGRLLTFFLQKMPKKQITENVYDYNESLREHGRLQKGFRWGGMRPLDFHA